MALDAAVTLAKNYITEAIANADQLSVGHGHGPVHHFHAMWRRIEDGEGNEKSNPA
jgi:hydroxymethylpyrimidine/phosphomethylpyrimidine kinase